MIQRIQTIYMSLLVMINLFLIVSIDNDPGMSLTESIFGNFRPYINEFFFPEILAFIFLINIFLFSKPKFQINILKISSIVLLLGLFSLFDERPLKTSITDPGLIYFSLSFFLIFMSVNAISKDVLIINSSNRIR
tara:strand:+ start:1894 stop:2298 length:405 start_codon:yes stop_codon:yes gene_type:complete